MMAENLTQALLTKDLEVPIILERQRGRQAGSLARFK